MKRILYISLVFLTLGTFVSCTNDVSMGDKESEIKKPPISLPGDVDGDGVLDENDNCPTLANADQADGNSNGIGDVCEDLECSSNFCQDGEFLSEHHCDGEVLVLCGINSEGCLEEVTRVDCVAGCQTSGDQVGECKPKPRDLTDPVIHDATGSRSHGSTITLTGEDFGEHDLNIEWTGDRIENDAVGTNAASWDNWTILLPNNSPDEHTITNEMAWSGNKSIDLEVDQPRDCGLSACGAHFSYLIPQGSNWGKILISYWYRTEPVTYDVGIGSKHLWITEYPPPYGHSFANPRNAIKCTLNIGADGTPGMHESIFNSYINCSDRPEDTFASMLPFTPAEAHGVGYDHPVGENATGASKEHGRGQGFSPSPSWGVNTEEWVRLTHYYDLGTLNTANGETYFALLRPDGESGAGNPDPGFYIGSWVEGILGSADSGYPGYSGDGCNGFSHPNTVGFYFATWNDKHDQHTKYWLDDIYIQIGTRSRVEIGNAPNYEDCTKLEIQNPTSWADGKIQFELNHGGSFKAGDKAYIFVINENEYDQGDKDAFGNGHYDFAGISPGHEIILE